MKAGAGADAPARADGDSDGLIDTSVRRHLLTDVAPACAGVTVGAGERPTDKTVGIAVGTSWCYSTRRRSPPLSNRVRRV